MHKSVVTNFTALIKLELHVTSLQIELHSFPCTIKLCSVAKSVSAFALHKRSIDTKDMKSLLRQINIIIDLKIRY
jgi:hypothetical protein